MSTPGEIVIQARLHPSGHWITVPLVVSGSIRLAAVLDTGSPVSAISARSEGILSEAGLLGTSTRPNRHILVSVTIERQPVPDVEVGVLRRLDRVSVDAIVGLDFLTKFAHIHFDTAALRLRLVPF